MKSMKSNTNFDSEKMNTSNTTQATEAATPATPAVEAENQPNNMPAKKEPRAVDLGMSEAQINMKRLVLVNPKAQFIASGGTEETFVRESGFALQALYNNPYLMGMEKQSIVNAVVNVALTGLTLNPELKLGYLVPRKGKLYFMSSYMGKVEILKRAGVVKEISAGLVRAGDTFEIVKGSNGYLKHVPNPWDTEGEIKGGYFFARLADGTEVFDTMPKKRIMEIKDMSESVKGGKQSPWDNNEEEMMRKTIINWAFKFLPKSNISKSMLQVLEVDSKLDNDIAEDLSKVNTANRDDFDNNDYEDAVIV